MGDMISRQATIDKINERQRELIYCFGFENDAVKIMDIAKSIVTAIPPAQPEQKKGRWIAWNGMDIPENHGKHKCSECGEFAPIEYDKPIIRERLTNYCPNCGCRLEEGESDESD